MSLYSTHLEVREAIVSAGSRLYNRGYAAAHNGNLSVRISDTQIWTTPTGVSKGSLTIDQLVQVDLEGNLLKGTRAPSSELSMHLQLYRENPKIRAVVHAHPPVATAFAVAGLPLDRPVMQEAAVMLGTVPVAPYACLGSQKVADSVVPFCHDYNGLLLEFHGAVTWGETLEQAYQRMECLEQYATILLHLKTLGCDRVMPPDLIAELDALRG